MIEVGRHLHVLSTTPASGKTVIATGLIRALRDRGQNVVPFKPVAESVLATDGTPDVPLSLCHQCFAADVDVMAEMAPVRVVVDRREADVWLFDECVGRVPMLGRDMPALGLLGDAPRRAVTKAIEASRTRLLERCDVLISEGSGAATALSELGLEDPANIEVGSLAGQVVLVARASNGTAFTTVDRVIAELRRCGVEVSGFLLNDVQGCRDAHETAARRAAERADVEYVGAMPWTDFFERRPKYEPPSQGCDEDHAHLAGLVVSALAIAWEWS